MFATKVSLQKKGTNISRVNGKLVHCFMFKEYRQGEFPVRRPMPRSICSVQRDIVCKINVSSESSIPPFSLCITPRE